MGGRESPAVGWGAVSWRTIQTEPMQQIQQINGHALKSNRAHFSLVFYRLLQSSDEMCTGSSKLRAKTSDVTFRNAGVLEDSGAEWS